MFFWKITWKRRIWAAFLSWILSFFLRFCSWELVRIFRFWSRGLAAFCLCMLWRGMRVGMCGLEGWSIGRMMLRCFRNGDIAWGWGISCLWGILVCRLWRCLGSRNCLILLIRKKLQRKFVMIWGWKRRFWAILKWNWKRNLGNWKEENFWGCLGFYRILSVIGRNLGIILIIWKIVRSWLRILKLYCKM